MLTRRERDGASPAKVLIIDDHPIVRHGLARVIGDEPDLEVCGAAASPAEALHALVATDPDIVVLDLSLGDDSGLELLKSIKARRPELPILVLSMHDEAYYADRVLRAGAMGYVMKQESTAHVIGAIHQVLAGKVYLSESMAASMLTRMVGGKATEGGSPVDSLTDRELQVLNLIGRGFGTRQIAELLRLSVKTVENYREHLKAKLKLQSSAELVRYAVRWDIEGGKST
jgi:DNA-binding NarL/FixJ family response regulator